MNSRILSAVLSLGACCSNACSLDASPIFGSADSGVARVPIDAAAKNEDAALGADGNTQPDGKTTMTGEGGAAGSDSPSNMTVPPSSASDTGSMPAVSMPNKAPSAAGATSNAGSGTSPDGGSGTARPPPPGPLADPSDSMRCGTSADTVMVPMTIVVGAGETFDGHCRRYVAVGSLAAQTEEPMFRLMAGAHLLNIVIGSPTADGIHTHGDAVLSNIVWEQIGEDALTVREAGTVKIDGGAANRGGNAVFEVNAASSLHISNFRAQNAAKLVRQDPGATFRVDLVIDHCDISSMTESIFRTDSNTSRVTMTNTRYRGIRGSLFMGVATPNITLSNNMPY